MAKYLYPVFDGIIFDHGEQFIIMYIDFFRNAKVTLLLKVDGLIERVDKQLISFHCLNWLTFFYPENRLFRLKNPQIAVLRVLLVFENLRCFQLNI